MYCPGMRIQSALFTMLTMAMRSCKYLLVLKVAQIMLHGLPPKRVFTLSCLLTILLAPLGVEGCSKSGGGSSSTTANMEKDVKQTDVFESRMKCLTFRRTLREDTLEMWKQMVNLCIHTHLNAENDQCIWKLTKSGSSL